MNLEEFTTYLVKGIVKNPDMVKVNSFSSDDELTLEIIVHADDMGAVIGKNGKNAKALRTLIYARSYLDNIKKVIVNIDSF